MTLALAAIILQSGPLKSSGPIKPLEVVPSVDLGRYAGTWHEIARLPNFFQRKCTGEITATYTLRPDGKITVVNACRMADGSITTARGTARVADKKGPNTKLKVSFFWPFSGNYWIIDLDPEYRWVAVGEPNRKYFWILSRTPQLEEPVLTAILERARAQGYDLSKLIRSAPAAPLAPK
jgi:apolipoprotein D and lipocalin family protein